MALRRLCLVTHRVVAAQHPAAPAAAMASRRAFGDRTRFDDMEEGRESQFIRKKDKEHLQGLLDKMQTAQRNQTEAKEALTKILGPNVPDNVVNQLFEWKEKYARTRLGVTGLER